MTSRDVQRLDFRIASRIRMKLFSCLLSLLLFVAAASAQSGYSESTPFVPRKDKQDQDKRSNKKKDSDKKKPDTPVDPVPVVSTPPTSAMVTVPISVRDRSGKPVTDLTQSEVSVFVDGAGVPVSAFEKTTDPPAVILVLDTSPSTELAMKSLKANAQQFVDALPQSTKVVVIEFNSELKVRCQITDDRAALSKCIEKADMGDGTSIYSAVRTMFEKVLPLVPGRKTVVMFTDGVDTTSQASTYAGSIAWVERSDIPVFPIYYDTFRVAQRGLSDDWLRVILQNLPPSSRGTLRPGAAPAEYENGRDYLTDLAAASGGRVIKTNDLADEARKLSDEIQSRYYATIEVSSNTAASRPLKVRVNRPNLIVRARGSIVPR